MKNESRRFKKYANTGATTGPLEHLNSQIPSVSRSHLKDTVTQYSNCRSATGVTTQKKFFGETRTNTDSRAFGGKNSTRKGDRLSKINQSSVSSSAGLRSLGSRGYLRVESKKGFSDFLE